MNDNKLIAEFMGLYDEISLDSIAGNIHSWSDAPFFYITEDSKEKVMEGITEYSKYHTSWDWLMPVIEEIDHLQRERIQSIEDALSTRCIGDVYNAVVEFIKSHTK